MGVAAVALGAIAGWNYFVHNAAWRGGQFASAVGVVTDLDRGRRSDTVTIEYSAGGRTVTAETRVTENTVDEGERLRVEYPVEDPDKVRIPGNWRPGYYVAGVAAAIASVFCLTAFLVHAFGSRRRR